MADLHIATSPLTNRIFVGRVAKNGFTWKEGKQDLTHEACGAVAEHVFKNGEPVEVSVNGQKKWKITVQDISAEERANG
jgi:hypothetical protein